MTSCRSTLLAFAIVFAVIAPTIRVVIYLINKETEQYINDIPVPTSTFIQDSKIQIVLMLIAAIMLVNVYLIRFAQMKGTYLSVLALLTAIVFLISDVTGVTPIAFIVGVIYQLLHLTVTIQDIKFQNKSHVTPTSISICQILFKFQILYLLLVTSITITSVIIYSVNKFLLDNHQFLVEWIAIFSINAYFYGFIPFFVADLLPDTSESDEFSMSPIKELSPKTTPSSSSNKCCLQFQHEFTIEYQVSESMIRWLTRYQYSTVRCILAIYTWAVLIYSLYWEAVPKFDTLYDTKHCCLQYWPLYFTFWGLAFVSIYWLCIIYLSIKVNQGYRLTSNFDKFISNIMRFTFIMGLIDSIIIVPLFWLMVYDGNTDKVYLVSTIHWHGVTMILIVIEWILNSLQLSYMSVGVALFNGFAYGCLVVLHYLQNWTDDTGRNYYLYSVMDFHSDSRLAVIYLVGTTVVGCILYVVMVMIKVIMMNYCCVNGGSKTFEVYDPDKVDSLPSAPPMVSYDGPGHVKIGVDCS